MKYLYIKILLLCLPITTVAQTYKCETNGKTVYSERPCGANAKKINIVDDNPADQERLNASAHVLNEMRSRQGLGDDIRRDAAERAEQRRQGSTSVAQSPKQSKLDYCNSLLRTAKTAKDDAAMYRTQGFIDDAKRRQKEAEDEHFSNCYGRNYQP